MKKQLGLAALGLAGLTAGAGAGLVLTGGSGDASAQTSPTTTPDTTAPTDSTDSSDSTDSTDEAKSTWLQEALAPLVEDGTITQAQADAVIGAIQEARPDRGGGRGGPGHGGFGRGGFGRLSLDTVAEALGITADELRTQLQDGTTIAAIAEAEGVDVATVKTAMLEAFRTDEQEHVTSGRLTQAQADANIAAFEARLDDLVSSTFPGRPGKDAPADDSATTTTTTTG